MKGRRLLRAPTSGVFGTRHPVNPTSEDSRSMVPKSAQACRGLPSALVGVDESLLRNISEDRPCSCGNHIPSSQTLLGGLWLWNPEILDTSQTRLCPEFLGARLKCHRDRGTRRWQSGSGAHFIVGTSTCGRQKTYVPSYQCSLPHGFINMLDYGVTR